MAAPITRYSFRAIKRPAEPFIGKQLFGQPCVNVRVSDKALPRLAAGNSANERDSTNLLITTARQKDTP